MIVFRIVVFNQFPIFIRVEVGAVIQIVAVAAHFILCVFQVNVHLRPLSVLVFNVAGRFRRDVGFARSVTGFAGNVFQMIVLTGFHVSFLIREIEMTMPSNNVTADAFRVKIAGRFSVLKRLERMGVLGLLPDVVLIFMARLAFFRSNVGATA